MSAVDMVWPEGLVLLTLRRERFASDGSSVELTFPRGTLTRRASNGDLVLDGGWVAMGRVELVDGAYMITEVLL